MQMWGAIQYVTSAVALVAFVAAAILYGYQRRLKSREVIIGLATESDRGALVRDTLEWLHVDQSKLN